MRLQASDIQQLYRPSRCELRVRLSKRGEESAPADAFTELLRDLGQRHEERHLLTFPTYVDLHEGDFGQRHEATLEAVSQREAVLYQPVLFRWRRSQGEDDFIFGIPDLLIREGDGYVIRDCKLARHADEKTHPETLRQLELYGWLYEQTFDRPPVRLEVLLGDGRLQDLPYDGGSRALAELDDIKRVASLPEEPYEPVGWSKCLGCGYHQRCWSAALARKDVSVVYGVDQSLARHLHGQGVESYEELMATLSADELAQVKRPWGARLHRVGVGAEGILRHAEALHTGQTQQIGPFSLPLEDHSYVVFDLEGIPPELDDIEKVYLWGMQLFGSSTGPYRPALAPPGAEGDMAGWLKFLEQSDLIFRQHGDLPFIHWAVYEKTMVNRYMGRYGDRNGIAQRVLRNLVDMLPIAQKTVVLPDPSYSLKVVERRAGFQRTMEEYGGSWSIAQYIRAVESGDEATYRATMDEILLYNQEDLLATWAVFRWLATNFACAPRLRQS